MQLQKTFEPAAILAESNSETGAKPDFNPTLHRIAAYSISLGFGLAAGVTAALEESPAGFTFRMSWASVAAFAVGATGGLFFWKIVAQRALGARSGTLLLVLGGAALFFYPLRFVPLDKLPDIAQGLGTALAAISFGLYLLWRVKRFFDLDSAAVENEGGAGSN
jgi:hypothetical protein